MLSRVRSPGMFHVPTETRFLSHEVWAQGTGG